MADRHLMGQMLETFVYQELSRQAGWYEAPVSFYHFRDKDGVEVEMVLESEGRHLAGIEIKAAATVTATDFSRPEKAAGCNDRALQRRGGAVWLGDGIIR